MLKDIEKWTDTDMEDKGEVVSTKDIKADTIKTCRELQSDMRVTKDKIEFHRIWGKIHGLMEWAGIKEKEL